MNNPRSFVSAQLDPWDGILLVNKPSGFTSHDVVAKIRGHFRIKKVGHGGTLDPMATGLLILLTGRGTRYSEQIMGSDKTYEGIMRLGISTDSQDADGKILEQKPADHITAEQVNEQMMSRVGDMMQTPPMVSAVKIKGVPLYKMARKGQVVEREARLIHVYQFLMLGKSGPEVSFSLKCTKGTYVRTLVSDIGDALGCGAHLQSLQRTVSGSFKLSDAFSLDELLRLDQQAFYDRIIPISRLPSLVA